MPLDSSQFVTGTLPDGSHVTFTDQASAISNGATLDATPNKKMIKKSSAASNSIMPTVAPLSTSGNTTTPTSQYFNNEVKSKTTTTSDPFRLGADKLGTDIEKTLLSPPSYNSKVYNDSMELVADMRKQLSARKAEEIKGIESEFGIAKGVQAQNQRSETGTQSMGLARMGGFDSASGQAVLTNLERVHQSEVQALIAKKTAAIRTANQAYEDKDFALAESQLALAKEAEQTKYDREQDYLQNVLAFKSDQRADLQFEFQKTQAQKQDARAAVDFALTYGIDKPFYIVGGVGYDSSTGDKLSYEDYAQRGGLPDFSNAYIIKPGTLEDKAFVQSLRDTYPDAGITSQDTAEQAQAKLKNSAKYRKETYIAPVGGYTGAKTTAQADAITRARAALAAEAGGSQDGKANPDTYRNFLSEYIQKGGDANDFYRAVSLDQFISEVNRKGDLTGVNADYKTATGMSEGEKQSRLNELIQKVNDGSASLQELMELQSLR